MEEIISDRVQELIQTHPTIDSLEDCFDAALEFVLENHVAGAHSHQAGVGAGLLQIVVRPGNHIGVTALEELGVELVGGVNLSLCRCTPTAQR